MFTACVPCSEVEGTEVESEAPSLYVSAFVSMKPFDIFKETWGQFTAVLLASKNESWTWRNVKLQHNESQSFNLSVLFADIYSAVWVVERLWWTVGFSLFRVTEDQVTGLSPHCPVSASAWVKASSTTAADFPPPAADKTFLCGLTSPKTSFTSRP